MPKAQTNRDELSDAAPWRQRQWGVVVCGAILLVILVAIFAGPSAPIVFLRLIPEAAMTLLWLAAMGGFGTLLPLPGSAKKPLRIVTRIAAGIGFISLLELGLGSAGLLHRAIAFAIIIIGIALLLWRCRACTRAPLAEWLDRPAKIEWLWLVALIPLAMAIVAAYVPPGILWGDEPNGYDVLEYHLQLPREWYELGKIVPLEHNVFSYFPSGSEMHDLLAMQLMGGPWAGMYLAQLFHVATMVLFVLAVYATAREFGSERMSMLAALAAASVPWVLLLAPIAYNESGLLLFSTLAVAWALRVMDWRNWLVGGAMAGLACGVKLTAVPQVLICVPIIAAVITVITRYSLMRMLISAAAFVLIGLVVFSPWLIRNAIATANPVFPEAQNIFGRGHFSRVQFERWHRAHSPRADQRSLAAHLAAFDDQIVLDWRYGWLMLPLGVAAMLLAIRRSQAIALLALFLAWLIFWIAFTHLQGRFFVLAIPLTAIAIALSARQAGNRVIAVAACLQILTGLVIGGTIFVQRVGPMRSVLGYDDLKGLLPQEVIQAIDAGKTLALVGDARAFLYQMPMSRLHYRTVFDVDAKPGESVIDAWTKGAPLGATIVVDPGELARFHRTYFDIPPMPADLPGAMDRPFILPPR